MKLSNLLNRLKSLEGLQSKPPECMTCRRQSVITCIYAPTARLEDVVLASLAATTEEFPKDTRFAAIDTATKNIYDFCEKNGWIIVEPDGGKPPRMKALLLKCLAQVHTKLVWTIEHDAIIKAGCRNNIMRMLNENPECAGIECCAVNHRNGAITAPCATKKLERLGEDLFSVRPYGSLNCEAWRTDVLKKLNWDKIPEFPRTDRGVSAEVFELGLILGLSKNNQCIHYHGRARRDLKRTAKQIVVILPTRNEGKMVLNTVRNFRRSILPGTRLDFVVIDDGSEDHCCDIFKGASDIVLRRNETAQGEAFCRNLGMEIAKTFEPEAGIVFDAHMEMETRGGLEMLADAAKTTGGLICGNVFQLNPHKRDFPRLGGRFYWVLESRGKMRPGLRMGWNYQRDNTENKTLYPCQGIYGASYAMTPETFDRVGGYTDIQGAYGYGEQAINIRAFFLDIPRLCHTGVHVKHFFRIKRPYKMAGLPYWWNFTWCNKIAFRDDIFRKIFLPMAKSQVPNDPKMLALAESEDAAKLRDEFALRKTHTDEECLAWLGIEGDFKMPAKKADYVERANWPDVRGAIDSFNKKGTSSIKFYQSIWRYQCIPKAAGGEHALDIGCGAGAGAIILKRLGYKVDALDVWDGCAKLLKEENINFLHVHLRSFTPERKYDLIVMSEVLEHLENPGGLLEKARHWIVPGGKLYITVPLENKAVSPNPFHRWAWHREDFVNLASKHWEVEKEIKPSEGFWALLEPRNIV